MRRRAFLAVAGTALAAGCSPLAEPVRGTIELENRAEEPVFFTVSAVPVGGPGGQEPPTFRTRYYVRSFEPVVLPEAVSDREHRISVTVYGVVEGERGDARGHARMPFDPEWNSQRVFVRYDPDGNGVTISAAD